MLAAGARTYSKVTHKQNRNIIGFNKLHITEKPQIFMVFLQQGVLKKLLFCKKNMDKLIVLFVFMCMSVSHSQKKVMPESFIKSEDAKVRWVKVFELNGSKEELTERMTEHFKAREFTRNLVLENGALNGYSNPIKVKPIKGGPLYNPATGFIKIDFKENRYRVTISNIKFQPMDIGVSVGAFSAGSTVQLDFEEKTLKANQKDFKRTWFNRDYLMSFDEAFTKEMQYTETSDDW